MENRRKIEPKEIPSRLIPHLLVVFTRQLEILVTTLLLHFTLGGVTDLFSLTYFQAAQKAHKEVVELLLDLDSSLVKVKDKNGRKPADFVPSHEQELRDMLKAE